MFYEEKKGDVSNVILNYSLNEFNRNEPESGQQNDQEQEASVSLQPTEPPEIISQMAEEPRPNSQNTKEFCADSGYSSTVTTEAPAEVKNAETGGILNNLKLAEAGEILENEESSDSDTSLVSFDSLSVHSTVEDLGDGERLSNEPIRTKNEIIEFPNVEPIDITIPEKAELVLVGKIVSMVADTLLVVAKESGEEKVLDIGSILIYGDRCIIGRVADTFGPVARPFYSVRFNTSQQCSDSYRDGATNINIGSDVYFVPSLVSVVITRPLKLIKGSDASNIYDEEIPEHEMEFSDDEQELLFKKKKKRITVGSEESSQSYVTHYTKDGCKTNKSVFRTTQSSNKNMHRKEPIRETPQTYQVQSFNPAYEQGRLNYSNQTMQFPFPPPLLVQGHDLNMFNSAMIQPGFQSQQLAIAQLGSLLMQLQNQQNSQNQQVETVDDKKSKDNK
jgi:rRNA processing protein Gar1